MMISSTGTLVRTPVGEISIVGRNTQGVRLIRLDEGERLTGVERIESLGGSDAGSEPRPKRSAATKTARRDPGLLIYSAPRAITSGVQRRAIRSG